MGTKIEGGSWVLACQSPPTNLEIALGPLRFRVLIEKWQLEMELLPGFLFP